MKTKNFFILLLLIGILFISNVSGLETLGTFERGEPVRIKQICYEATYINISSISYPNSTISITNVGMTEYSPGAFNFTFNNASYLGRYNVEGVSDGCEGEFATYFTITPNGRTFGDAEGLAALGVLVGVLAMTFFFSFLGFKMGSNEKLLPISFMFIILSLILAVYSLYLGWVYSSEIVVFENLSNIAETIFLTFLWLVIGIAVLSMALMLIAFIKELGTIKRNKDFGDGFNPITGSYDI